MFCVRPFSSGINVCRFVFGGDVKAGDGAVQSCGVA